jgi:hypothetical protein
MDVDGRTRRALLPSPIFVGAAMARSFRLVSNSLRSAAPRTHGDRVSRPSARQWR